MNADERQLRETIARCVSCMVFHHNVRKTPKGKAQTVAELGAIADMVRDIELRAGEVNDRILGPVEAELVTRYGREVGGDLYADFAKAFGGTRDSGIPPLPAVRVEPI